MDLKLKGKRAFVLGASTGIGYAVAEELIREGATVAICARNEERLRKSAQALGAHFAIAGDLSKPGAGRELVMKVIEKMGGIDILITNTGGPPKGLFEDLKAEDWLAGFQGLWMSAVEAIQAALPAMKERKWGRILLVTSAAAKEPMPALTVSNGLRAGLLGLTKSISNEIASHGVTINALLPGYTRTERLKELHIPEEKITSQNPKNSPHWRHFWLLRRPPTSRARRSQSTVAISEESKTTSTRKKPPGSLPERL